jgi:DinB superfamily
VAAKTTKGRKRAGGRVRSGRRLGGHAPSRGLAGELAEFTRQTAAGRNWGHSGLTRVLRGVTLDEAAWTPWPEVHSIWEELNHIFYWSEDILHTLEGRGVSRPQAWPAGGDSPDDWRRAIARVKRLHATLVRRVAAAGPAELVRTAPRSRLSHAQRILGGVSHIAYHTGRIALLRRMYAQAHSNSGPDKRVPGAPGPQASAPAPGSPPPTS